VAGDGDHGTTMLRIVDRLETAFQPESTADLKTSFSDAGWNVMGCDGGASSSLLGAFFLGIGDATAAGVSSWSCSELAAALHAGLQSVESQTKARPGDKTLMDALTPAVEACVAEAHAGHELTVALHAAAQAADAGVTATESQIAHYGRARLLGDKTKGHQDPGAASVALLFAGFAEAMPQKGDAAHARRG
jgi:phosphoenolpyruvate---glycerone phosphotransferase subunit DhaL